MIQDKQNVIVDLSQFKMGLNTIPDYDVLNIEQSPNCMDVVFGENGRLEKRYGRSKLNSSSTGATDTCFGLFDYGPTSSSKKLLAKFGTTIYKMDDLDGTLDSLSASRGASNMHCAQSRTNVIICEDLCYPELYWDGTVASAILLNAASPRMRYPINWQGYLFIGYNPTYPRRFYYEDDTTTTTGLWEDYYDIRTTRGNDELTGWGISKNRLYAFMKQSIHRISYLGGSPLFEVNEVISTTGAVPRTIQLIELPSGQEAFIFLNYQKKICIFDGTNVQAISLSVEKDNNQCPVYLDAINRGGLSNCHAHVDRENSLYHLYLPISQNVNMSHRITLNYRIMCFYPSSNQTLHSSCTASDAIERRSVLAGGYDGHIYKMNTGNTDSGTAINEYYTSIKIGAARTTSLKKAKKIALYFEPTSNDTIDYYERLNFDKTWTLRNSDIRMYNDADDFLGVDFILGTSVLGSVKDVTKNVIDLPVINNLYQFKIMSNSSIKTPWILNKMEFIEKEMGKGSTYENTR